MTKNRLCLAVFEEIGPATKGLDVLRDHGLSEADMQVLSGEPHSAEILGRPLLKTNVPFIGITGFVVGFLVAFGLVWGTPQQYPIQVGARPLCAIPPWLVLTFEFSMLGLLVGTFLGVIWESRFPAFGPHPYDQRISDGHAGVLFTCPGKKLAGVQADLEEIGGELVEDLEAKNL